MSKHIDVDSLCVIRPGKPSEKGQWVVVVEGLPLSVGWDDLDDAMRFTRVILGASAYKQKGNNYIVTRFEFQRKYRVPNHYSLDEAMRSLQ